MFSDLSANTPDVVVINEECREVSILEMACTFDSSMEEAFLTKVIKSTTPKCYFRDRLSGPITCFHIWQFRTHTQAGCKRSSTTWDAQKEG